MASFNQTILIGNLTRDPDLRVTPKGTAICQFSLAVNRKFKDDSGQMRDETTYVDIEAWGKQAELIAKYLIKGSPALVQGRLKLDQWDDKQSGQKRSKLKVVLENVQFLGGKPTGPGQDQEAQERAEPHRSQDTMPASYSPAQPKPRGAAVPAPANNFDDSDVPF